MVSTLSSSPLQMDAFADLWNNSSGTSGQNTGDATLGAKQQQLSKQPARSMQATPPANDAFARLASAGSLANPPRQPPERTSGAVPIPPASSRPNGSPSTSGSPRPSGDPFSGLLSLGTSTNVNMSMADRRAHAERERREREKRDKARVEAQGAMWDQLDGALSGSSSVTNSRAVSPVPTPSLRLASAVTSLPPSGLKTNPGVKPSPPTSNSDIFWSLNAPLQNIHAVTSRNVSPALVPHRAPPNQAPTHRRSSPTFADISRQQSLPVPSTNASGGPDSDLLILDSTASKATPAAPTPRRPNQTSDPFGFHLLEPSSNKEVFGSPAGSRSRTPGDFDFGSSEDLEQSAEDDDILGDLAKPIDEVRRKRVAPPVSNDFQSPSSSSISLPSGRTSPPPHIIGQIVEMGFTPQQARTALAATDSGLNVQEALDSLLAANIVDSEVEQPPRRSRPREPEDLHVPSTSRSRTQTPAVDSPAGSGALNADKILAQATEIGSTLFSRANAFWKQGKEQVQKAYEEAAKGSATPPSDGRPKWMQGAPETEPVSTRGAERTPQGDFKYAPDDDLPQSTPRKRKPSGPNTTTQEYAPSAAPSRKDDLASMFSEDTPAYVSPHRRRMGHPSTSARASPNPTPAPTVAAAPPSRRAIQVDSVSSYALSSCAASRTKGTEKFKLGQFAEAEAAYTSAITCLPPNHALLIILYTNRAASRLKTGDSGGAAGDCTTALRIMGVSEDLGGIRDLELSVLDGPGAGSIGRLEPKEQAVKAIQRRANAFEAMERWERARADWEKLAGLGWADRKAREEAIRSAKRCRETVVRGTEGGGGLMNGAAMPASKPKPKSNIPARREIQPSGEAVRKLQKVAAAQEAEDSLKADLKDSVDARITAWKSNKENNLRALIASLENVLWPELGWVKVGMHELVTPSQVKIRYTKAIAKVHPDKLSANTTVEQRMVANAVFAGLSDAWVSFKQ